MLLPICIILLFFSVWNIYKSKYSFKYLPFILASVGALLFVLDSFVFNWVTYDIPSWIGNIMIIVAAIWSSRDNAKAQSLFDF